MFHKLHTASYEYTSERHNVLFFYEYQDTWGSYDEMVRVLRVWSWVSLSESSQSMVLLSVTKNMHVDIANSHSECKMHASLVLLWFRWSEHYLGLYANMYIKSCTNCRLLWAFCYWWKVYNFNEQYEFHIIFFSSSPPPPTLFNCICFVKHDLGLFCMSVSYNLLYINYISVMLISDCRICSCAFIPAFAAAHWFMSFSASPCLRIVSIFHSEKRKRDHITPLLNKLHWLPVKFRCEYKIAILAYRHFDGTLPTYLSAFFCTYQTSRGLWSLNEKLLKIPTCSLRSIGNHSFNFIVPSVWNSLPARLLNIPTLSDFKAQLKTFFF